MTALPQATQDALDNGSAGFTSHDDGTLSVDGPEAVMLYRIVAIRRALALEIRTGMKLSRGVSALKAANTVLGTNHKTKQKAFDHLSQILGDMSPQRSGN